jgi:hypothetical protein
VVQDFRRFGISRSRSDRCRKAYIMRSLNFTTAAIFGMAAIVLPAHAQTGYVVDGMGTGREPVSTRASNIVPENTRSAIAPALPSPPVGADSGPRVFLRAARDALAAGRTGEAQQSLEMAETRVLSRSVPAEAAGMPDPDPMVGQIRDALHALGAGDRARALNIIDAMAG